MARAALFDVDGTLVDTTHLHAVTWWEALRQAGHRVPTATIHRAGGLAPEALLAHLLGDERDAARDAEIIAAHATLYATYGDRLPAFDGAADLIRALTSRGWRVVLATSADERERAAVHRALDADDVLWRGPEGPGAADAAGLGDGGAGWSGPRPGPRAHSRVADALRRAGVPADRAVFVGDSVWDLEAAAHAGIRSVAVLTGGIPRTALESAGAEAVYLDPLDLLATLDDSLFAEAEAEGRGRRIRGRGES